MKTMKKVLAVFLSMLMCLGVLSVSAFADEGMTASGEAVTFVGITIELPEDGVYPATSTISIQKLMNS